MKQFYVNDITKLRDYGFRLTERHEYWLKCRRSLNIIVQEDSGLLTFYSASRDAIAIVCEMYKNGVVDILEDCEVATFNMKVTEEEMRMVYKHRKEKDNERNN